MNRECDSCGVEYEAQRKTSRYCSTRCRMRASRRPETPVAAESPDNGGLLNALRRELADAGRLDTALGQQAMALAVKLASPRDTGSSMAAVSRELRAVREEALRGAGQDASPLSRARGELAARRTRRSA